MHTRSLWVAASLAIGLLQAWDSSAFSFGTPITALTVAGIGLPTAAMAMPLHHGVRIGALIVGALLLVAARAMAPASLNGLHLALFPAALYILVLKGVFSNGRQHAA